MEVLEEIVKDMKIEKIILAEEIREKNHDVLEEILALVNEMDTECEIEYIPHTEFKMCTKACKAVVRTGETTPYANIILQSACLF